MEGIPWGGSEILWYKTAKHARTKGCEVLISVYDWGVEVPNINELKNQGCIVSFRPLYSNNKIGFKKIMYSLKNRISGYKRFYQSIIDFRPDCVIINQGNTFDLVVHHKVLSELLVLEKIPYYILCHSHVQYSSIPNSKVYSDASKIFASAKKVFYVSNRMRLCIERQLCSPLKNGEFTWNPLNLETHDVVEWPNRLNLSFAVVGNITGSKGHDILFEALSTKEWYDRQWELNVYGNGDGVEYIKELANYYMINNKIVYHGHVSDIRKIWSENHLLIVPSSSEGMPISLVEAMICGRPAVVTDVGGNCELITEGLNGFVAEAPHSKYIGEALDRAWNSREQLQNYGLCARETVLRLVDLTPEISLYKLIANG